MANGINPKTQFLLRARAMQAEKYKSKPHRLCLADIKTVNPNPIKEVQQQMRNKNTFLIRFKSEICLQIAVGSFSHTSASPCCSNAYV